MAPFLTSNDLIAAERELAVKTVPIGANGGTEMTKP